MYHVSSVINVIFRPNYIKFKQIIFLRRDYAVHSRDFRPIALDISKNISSILIAKAWK